MGIVLKIAPTEAHNKIGKVERQHAVLRSIYKKLKMDLPNLSRYERLTLAFRAINDAPDSNTGISPTALVFGVHPKIPGSGPRGTMAQRAHIVRECTKIAATAKARNNLIQSSRLRNIADIRRSDEIRKLQPGCTILVYRENFGWKTYELVRCIENYVEIVLRKGKIGRFPINNAKPFHLESNAETNGQRKTRNDTTGGMKTRSMTRKLNIDSDNYFKIDVYKRMNSGKSNTAKFITSRQEELNGLIELGCFEVVDESQAKGHRIYNYKFDDRVKSDGSLKSRLCVAAHSDKSHGLFTAAPTVRRKSIRLHVSISVSLNFKCRLRDVHKAFVNAQTNLRRPVFMRASPEMGLPPGTIVEVCRTLYGMPESPIHWFKTYTDYNYSELDMQPILMDPCLLVCQSNGTTEGIIALQVDDTLISGSSEFLEKENKKSVKFPNSGFKEICNQSQFYNGIQICTTKNGLRLHQEKSISELPPLPSKNNLCFEIFQTMRAKYAYISYATSPNSLVLTSKLSQVTKENFEKDPQVQRKSLFILEKLLMEPSHGYGLTYVKLDMKNTEVCVCIDAAFATNSDLTSQIGILVLLREYDSGKANIILYTSTKSKRVCRSVLSSELFAFVDGLDMGILIKHSVADSFGFNNIPLSIYTDSKSLFSLAITLGQTTEKRLQIDLSLIREAFEKRDINEIFWIPGNENPADCLTKYEKRSNMLSRLVETNKFMPTEILKMDRDVDQVKTIEALLNMQ